MAHLDPDVGRLWDQFHAVVNMAAPDLRSWLGTAPEGPDAYLYDPDHEPRELGRDVLRVLKKRRCDVDRHDLWTMRTVVEVFPSWALRFPPHDVTDARWRHSLMCLGHDPLRAG